MPEPLPTKIEKNQTHILFTSSGSSLPIPLKYKIVKLMMIPVSESTLPDYPFSAAFILHCLQHSLSLHALQSRI
jgi:hypothetical protein